VQLLHWCLQYPFSL